MEKNEVSIHEAKLFIALRQSGKQWMTSKDVAKASGVAERTARSHLLKLSQMGIAECAEVFPGHRYRMAEKAAKRNGGYLHRLQKACEVFALAGG